MPRISLLILFLVNFSGSWSQNVRPEVEVPRLQYNTCDLDLSPEIHDQLPKECLKVGPELKEKLLQESNLFRQFWERLENYEKQQDLVYQQIIINDPLAAAIPEKDWTLRHKLYEAADLMLCQNGTDVTYDQFADCMILKRNQMIYMFESETRKVGHPGTLLQSGTN